MIPGIFVTLWSGGKGGMLKATKAELAWLARVQPDGIIVHSDAEGLLRDAPKAVETLRAALPHVRIVVGLGCDGAYRRACKNAAQWQAEINAIASVVGLANELQASALSLDPEAAYKEPGSRDAAFARDVLERVASLKITSDLWITSYDQPTLHSTYEWRAWLNGECAVQAYLPQCYPAGPGYKVTRRMLGARIAQSRSAIATARAKQWIAADVEALDTYVYLQAWGHDADAIAHHATMHDVVAMWAADGGGKTIDDDGRKGIEAALRLRKHGTGTTGIMSAQAALSITADGIVGPATLSAILSN